MGDEDFVDEFEESLASEPPSPQKQSPKKTSPQQTTPSQKYTAESLLLDNSLMSSMQSKLDGLGWSCQPELACG